jgi:hypothetical protein
MKKLLAIVLILSSVRIFAAGFDQYFENRTLRIDYTHAGDATSDEYFIDELKAEPFWGGSHENLIDNMSYGIYLFKVFDQASNTLLYSRGYCTLFDEWQATAEAKITRRSFSETVVMPFPKKNVRVEFYTRNHKGGYDKKFEYVVDVKSYFITPERKYKFPVYDAYISGDPKNCVDIVILPEGYTAQEMDKFKADCKKFVDGLFTFDPYSKNKSKFNIRCVLAPSPESGVDIPARNIWKQTLLNANFYTFDSDRYLMTYDNKSLRDMAANAPYDQIYIIANTSKYGGGGIYNDYCVSVNSNASAAKIFIHEFGHGFAGLADEYYDSSTSYNDFYPKDVEPWEPNLTTLVDFGRKWKSMLPPGTPIPTKPDIENPLKLGVFEGGGYVTKGVYRPAYDCLMDSFKVDEFCDVCKKSIQKMIDFYCK